MCHDGARMSYNHLVTEMYVGMRQNMRDSRYILQLEFLTDALQGHRRSSQGWQHRVNPGTAQTVRPVSPRRIASSAPHSQTTVAQVAGGKERVSSAPDAMTGYQCALPCSLPYCRPRSKLLCTLSPKKIPGGREIPLRYLCCVDAGRGGMGVTALYAY